MGLIGFSIFPQRILLVIIDLFCVIKFVDNPSVATGVYWLSSLPVDYLCHKFMSSSLIFECRVIFIDI